MTDSRAIWKGAITFGMVVVPVAIHTATESKDISFRQVRKSDGSRIQLRRVAATDGQEVPYSEVAKGYELTSGDIVVLTDDDMATLPLPTAKRIEVVHFTDPEEVNPVLFAKSYYLVPDAVGSHSYQLLAAEMYRLRRWAIVKVAIRARESVAVVRSIHVGTEGQEVAIGGAPALVLTLLNWPDEVRAFPELPLPTETSAAERKMAQSLITTMTEPFDPAAHADGYRVALESVVAAKVEGKVAVFKAAEAEAEPSSDLNAMLLASVEAAKAAKVAKIKAAPPQDAQ